MPEFGLGRAEGEIALTYKGDGAQAAQRDLTTLQKGSVGSSAAVGKVGTAALIAGAAVAGGFALAVNSAANFEQRMSAVGAVSGATGDQMDAMRGKALQLGKDTAFSATDAASAMEELVKAGVKVPDVLNGAADATVALAAAGEVSLPRAAEVAANAMGAFNLTAKEMPHIADLYAGAANASAISVDELAQSMTAVAAVAHTVGLSVDDTTAAIGLLGNAGIKGSDAGTSLKTMLMNLQPVTDKQKKLFKELGIVTEDGSNKFFDAKGNVKDMAGISQTLQDALKGQTKQQKLATLETLFGSDAIRAAAVLADQGSKGVNKFADSMGKVTAADVAAKRMDNFKGSLEQFRGSLETAGIAIGTIILPALRALVDGITSALNVFLSLDSGTQKIIVAIIAFVGAILLALGAFIKIAQAIKTITGALEVYRTVVASSWAATLGPILLIIAAIALLVAAIIILWKNSETFRNIVLAVWGAVKAAISAVVDWITGTVVPSLQQAWNQAKTAMTALKNFFVTVWNGIVSFFTGVFNIIRSMVTSYFNLYKSIITTIFNAVKSVVSTVWNAILAVIRAVLGVITTVVENEIQGIKNIWSKLTALAGIVSRIFAAVHDAIASKMTAVVEFIKGQIDRIKNFFSGAVTWLVQAGRDLIQGLITGISGMAHTLLTKVTDMVNSVKDKITGLFDIGSPSKWAEEIGKFVAQGLAIGIEKTKSEVADAANEMADALTGALENRLKHHKITPEAARNLREFVHEQKQQLLELASDRENIVERLKAARSALEDALKVRDDFARQTAGGAMDWASLTGIKTGENADEIPDAGGLISGLRDRLAALIGYRDKLNTLAASGLNRETFAQLVASGVEAGSGYADAIIAGGADAVTSINDLQGQIASVSTALGASAATELYQAGVDAAQGLVAGLRSQRDALTREMNHLAHLMVRAIRRALRMGSPSKLLFDNAFLAMQGWVDGVEAQQSNVFGAVRRLGAGVPGALSGALPPGMTSATRAATEGASAAAAYTDARQFNLEAHTDADPSEIMSEFAWASKTTLSPGGRR